jgi:NADH:ubiquinone reductase (H+-translocating)
VEDRAKDVKLSPAIVIVGGGAGGLELATRIGNKLGRRSKARIMLIDRSRTHLWKPLLHEVAAGSMDQDLHEIDYMAQAHWHGFSYRIGEMIGLDRQRRQITVGPHIDQDGEQVTAGFAISYDMLVIAVGSETNDFGTPGVAENAIFLETPDEAARFHRKLVNACIRANAQSEPLRPDQLHVAIIGGGATGTELAAELHRTTRQLIAFGLDRVDPERDIKISLIEAGPRILPALSERIATAASGLLHGLGVKIYTGAKVTKIIPRGVCLGDGTLLPAELVVWSAGIRAPKFLKDLDGLERNSLNQLKVRLTLQTTREDAVFAIGDCAECPWPGHARPVPPRAQAAHQQATHMGKQIVRYLKGLPLKDWHYRDRGSLVALGEYSAVGNLMGRLVGGSLFIEGMVARLMYNSLYKLHELALHGMAKVVLDTLARLITRRTEPQVKLH